MLLPGSQLSSRAAMASESAAFQSPSGSLAMVLGQICQPGGFLPRIDAEARQRRQDGERHADLFLADGGEEESVVLGVAEGIFATQCHDASSR